MSIAKKLAYMPKSRNRSSEAKALVPEVTQDENEPFVTYTLAEEEEMARAARGITGSGSMSSTIAPASPGASEVSKTASSMWLQSRMKNANNANSMSKSGMPKYGAGTAPASAALTHMRHMSRSDTRYLTKTSLPYSRPPLIAESKHQPSNQREPELADSALLVSNEKKQSHSEFNSFMKSTSFAAKANRLVRQCLHCQILYSTSHTCGGLAPATGQDFK